jgi:hypothetical protein
MIQKYDSKGAWRDQKGETQILCQVSVPFWKISYVVFESKYWMKQGSHCWLNTKAYVTHNAPGGG